MAGFYKKIRELGRLQRFQGGEGYFKFVFLYDNLQSVT